MTHAQDTTTLTALHDHKRVLLVFAGDHDPRVEDQWSILVHHRDEASQRDLVTVLLTRSLVKKHDGNAPPTAVFIPAEGQRLRDRFHIRTDSFTVLLIGKDGGEKLRSQQPISWQNLQSIIDAMPMR